MPDTAHDIGTPDRKTLIRFLSERRPYGVAEAAAVLSWPRDVLRQHAKSEAALQGGVIAWGDVAMWLLDTWPLTTLIDTLGDQADLLPVGLHPLPLLVQQPAYVVHALRVQWRLDPLLHRVARPATFDEYLADLLHQAIEPTTVAALQGDPEFVQAYEIRDGGAT